MTVRTGADSQQGAPVHRGARYLGGRGLQGIVVSTVLIVVLAPNV